MLDAADKDLKSLEDKLDTGEMMGGIELGDLSSARRSKSCRAPCNVLARLPSGNASLCVIIGTTASATSVEGGASSRAKGDETDQIHYGRRQRVRRRRAAQIAQLLSAQQKAGKLPLKRDIVFRRLVGRGDQLARLVPLRPKRRQSGGRCRRRRSAPAIPPT
ncbi:MAG: hypothetical protein R3F11_31320 [Verrucomicrobiales bacterium]